MNMNQWHRSSTIFEAISFAFLGLKGVFVREINVRVQVVIGTLVVCAMLYLRLPFFHMAVLVLAIILVITLEIINTSFEILSDIVHPEFSEKIRDVKDMAAGAVLLASIGACIVGILILLPALIFYV
ncbi:MAG: diacylglycerol kinase family protein [bacterium]|nr:diacylglycerol kinase family protein [bacterium]